MCMDMVKHSFLLHSNEDYIFRSLFFLDFRKIYLRAIHSSEWNLILIENRFYVSRTDQLTS